MAERKWNFVEIDVICILDNGRQYHGGRADHRGWGTGGLSYGRDNHIQDTKKTGGLFWENGFYYYHSWEGI